MRDVKTSWSTPRRVTFSCGAIKRGKAAESVPSTSTFDLKGFVRLQLRPDELCIAFVVFLQSEIEVLPDGKMVEQVLHVLVCDPICM